VRQLLRHETDQGARGAVVRDDVFPSTRTLPALGLTMPHIVPISVSSRTVGPRKAKISPRRSQIDVLESPETGGVVFESLLTEMMPCMKGRSPMAELYRRQLRISGRGRPGELSAGDGSVADPPRFLPWGRRRRLWIIARGDRGFPGHPARRPVDCPKRA